MRRNVGNPFSVIYDQLHKQALFVFASHPTLNTVGFILTLGELWQYGEFSRPADNLLSSWSEAKDPSWTRSARKVAVKVHVPDFLRSLSGNNWFAFSLMDMNGKSAVAFKFIADLIKARESDFWGLPLPKPTGQ
ncbi:hypothetical protein AZE42_11247 [Rhizopogon vesiculosus]|uniref:Uncharacterized protein n=1 Tax=Rhizopogon vesiculosus TaxID=180088 RepID=A0A1J8PTJ7_9AGAM|nr:hypothetical protein AZE42_11247 [Rhizopogon vesiculosus]